MILVVDDLRSFPFATNYARTSVEAVQFLRRAHSGHHDLDELWLDHDLGGDDTIMPVVHMLEEWAHFGDPLPIGRVVIHSANPVGVKNITAALGRHYRVFTTNASEHGCTSGEW